jgi:hypothetical protein
MRMVITIPKSALSKYRPLILPCARCGAELPITEEDENYVYISLWQGNKQSYCCEEHVRPQ